MREDKGQPAGARLQSALKYRASHSAKGSLGHWSHWVTGVTVDCSTTTATLIGGLDQHAAQAGKPDMGGGLGRSKQCSLAAEEITRQA